MIIREAEYKDCPTCGARRSSRAPVYGCDRCGKVIDVEKRVGYLDMAIFFKGNKESKHHLLCGLPCVIAWLHAFRIPRDFSFLNIPLLSGRANVLEFRKHLKK